MGDLVVTCWSRHSRNRRAGELLVRGLTPDQALAEIGMTVEGLTTAPVVRDLARRSTSSCPITEAVCAVLDGTDAARARLKPYGAGADNRIAYFGSVRFPPSGSPGRRAAAAALAACGGGAGTRRLGNSPPARELLAAGAPVFVRSTGTSIPSQWTGSEALLQRFPSGGEAIDRLVGGADRKEASTRDRAAAGARPRGRHRAARSAAGRRARRSCC